MRALKHKTTILLSILLMACMTLSIVPLLSKATLAVNTSVEITNSMDVVNINSAIQGAIDGAARGESITIAGSKTNANAVINIIIPLGVTVKWEAVSENLSFKINGGGTFEVADGGKINVVNKDAISVVSGNVIVSGGMISATGSYCTAIDITTGNVIVSGGAVIADGAGLHGCYAIYLSGPGTVAVTGGVVSAHNAVANMFCITLRDGGLSACLEGTYTGDLSAYGDGIIVEVKSLDIPASYGGTVNGLTHKSGGDISTVRWNTSGVIPIISFNNAQYAIEWAAPGSAVPVIPAKNSVRIQETGAVFDTLTDAIETANSKGLAAFTLEVIGNIAEKSDVFIKSNITIVGAGGKHTILSCNIRVQDGGRLTLGHGADTNTLTISGAVSVTNGSVNIKDGVNIKSGGYALHINGSNATGAISGGRFEGNSVALYMENGARLSNISGGVFSGIQNAVLMSGEGTKIDVISSGSFYQTDTATAIHGHVIFVSSGAQIGLISGGYFEAALHSALLIIRGGWVDEISGGEFIANNRNYYNLSGEYIGNAVVHIEAEANLKTGIGTISGGLFHGSAHFGILLINWFDSITGPRINTICGGTIQGAVVGLQPDVKTNIGVISGGTITGRQGMLNAGTIGLISGGVINGTNSYGIFNYSGGQIDEISGGAIIGDRSHGIANAGTIKLISGGVIIGGDSAVYCNGTTKGKLETITNGVFWGKGNAAITLAATIAQEYILQLEPGLNANIGLGRYWGNNGVVFNNESMVIYPNGYSMSTKTLTVSGVNCDGFKYLVLPKYTVTVNDSYAANSGAGSYSQGTLVTINAGTKNGCAFTGWTVSSGGVVLSDASNAGASFSMPESDVTVAAHWAAAAYTVYYYPNGGTGSMPSETAVHGDDFTLSKNTFTRPGYTFTGWNTTPSGGALSYPDEYTFSPWTRNDDLTLYAQ
ncbi:MAG: InlB B-repeat-containing protein, partial [Dehalococcoidia bacterium]|nr:InlB B-repeat-containing protein [Dehalococcoidia bacterium]